MVVKYSCFREKFIPVTAGICLIIGIFASFVREQKISQENSAVFSPSSANIDFIDEGHSVFLKKHLTPVSSPENEASPMRFRPYHLVATLDGNKAYVTTTGKEHHPKEEVLVLDLNAFKEISRISVGRFPYGLALHPTGRWVFITNRFSNFISVVDVVSDQVITEIEVPFYCEDIVFSPNGDCAYVSNFWKNQVMILDLKEENGRISGQMRRLGFEPDQFFGQYSQREERYFRCTRCQMYLDDATVCPQCHQVLREEKETQLFCSQIGIAPILRANCGTSECHLYPTGGFYAGPDKQKILESAKAHIFPGDPIHSPLLKSVLSHQEGGWADRVDGRHHTGGIIFKELEQNSDYQEIFQWILKSTKGPGISVGDKPRDMAVSSDGKRLYVANTGSLDVSVVDLVTLRETDRIFTRSPVNDLCWHQDALILATLGVGSGHPKAHHAGRESNDRNHPEAEFTLFRDLTSGKALPLEKQDPLGPYDAVDGTAQEKFRDITNDLIWLKPEAKNVASYQATEAFTRYTSDSFEALAGDEKGDLPPELMKVVGSFPEQMICFQDKLYVTMSGTFQVQEWLIETTASPHLRLQPRRVFSTGFKPIGITIAQEKLWVANQLGDSVSCIDLQTGKTQELHLNPESVAFPANDFERGEFFVQTSVFSVDQDQSCVHCHYRDASDGKKWSVSQVMGQSRTGKERTGGSREVPDLRALASKVPFFLEGTLSIDEPLTMMMEHNPLIDFQGATPAGDFTSIFLPKGASIAPSADMVVNATNQFSIKGVSLEDLIYRRELHFQQISERYLGQRYSFRDFQKFIGAYQKEELRLLPNPNDRQDSMVQHGRTLFESPEVGCAGCHPAPHFTDKVQVYNQNKAFPPLITPTFRDKVHNLVSADRIDFLREYKRPWDLEDQGRVEEKEGFYIAPSLRGIWSRAPRFLHHGHALSLREVICTPDHPALQPFTFGPYDEVRSQNQEKGFNELYGLPDTHGTTSHLSIWDIVCLIEFLHSIE